MIAMRFKVMAVLAAGALIAACGNDDQPTEASGPGSGNDAEDAAPGPDDDGMDGTGAAGTVVVNGTEYGIDSVRACIPFSDDTRAGTWSVQGRGLEDPTMPGRGSFTVRVSQHDVIQGSGDRESRHPVEQVYYAGDEGPLELAAYLGGGADPDGWYTRRGMGAELIDGFPVSVTDDRIVADVEHPTEGWTLSIDMENPSDDPVDCAFG